jgi:hypothetical protein
MSRRQYLAALVRLYLEQPGAPPCPSRQDWAVAQTLYAQGVPLPDLTHAIRLATLRRLHRIGEPLPPVRCLAYYRQVLDQLAPDERDPAYVAYVADRHAELIAQQARSDRQDRALSDRR